LQYQDANTEKSNLLKIKRTSIDVSPAISGCELEMLILSDIIIKNVRKVSFSKMHKTYALF